MVTSCVAGLGLTVALFVCGQAFVDPSLRAAAKMGAVFSVSAAVVAFAMKVVLRVSNQDAATVPENEASKISPEGATLDSLDAAQTAVDEALAVTRNSETAKT